MLAKVTVAEAAEAAAANPGGVRLEIVAPFVEAAARVLAQECGEQVGKGEIHRVRSPRTSGAVSAMVAVTGGVAGLAIYSMSLETATGLASRMIGEPLAELDDMGQSAIAELANMITGQAGIKLEANGFPSDMSPPALVVGAGSSIATFDLTRLVIPLVLSFGNFNIDVAIKESS